MRDRNRSSAHLDDDAFALVLGMQSLRKEVHESLNEIRGKCFRPKVQLKDRERDSITYRNDKTEYTSCAVVCG